MKINQHFFHLLCMLFPCAAVFETKAQSISLPDSISISILPGYDSVGKFHRNIFGENYRKEYSLPTRVPIIQLSRIAGGLKATQKGGGNQTHSLRLEDPQGNEWTLRSIEKYPENLIPEQLRNTFLKDIIKDNMSAQHPFAALVVPELAQALGVPHSSPVIGWVASDPGLGVYLHDFQQTLCLLEIREPIGKTDNTSKMLSKLVQDNDINVDWEMYLKLKCLDVLLGDWDRHEDQWRWKLQQTTHGKIYLPVPRDRDQVFYRSEGKIQRIAQSSWLLPMMQGYERDIQDINWFLWEGREMNSRIFAQVDEEKWMSVIRDFCAAITDERLFSAVRKLPEPGYSLRQKDLIAQLIKRRDALPALMRKYYKFFNQVVDIELSDKNEFVELTQASGDGLGVVVSKLNRTGKLGKQLYARSFNPEVTKEVRIYLHSGTDSISVHAVTSPIKVRIIGGEDRKTYNVDKRAPRIITYDKMLNTVYAGAGINRLDKHSSNDSVNTVYIAKDLYSRRLIFPMIGYNNDDGVAAGVSINLLNPAFRKVPYGNKQSLSLLYSLATSAIRFQYSGEWSKSVGNADLIINANVFAPNNLQNFFGFGNDTDYDQSLGINYYRIRFNLYQLEPSLTWHRGNSSISIGPSVQYYHYKSKDNYGRFTQSEQIENLSDYDRLQDERIYTGLTFSYTFDSRLGKVLPSKGIELTAQLKASKGLNGISDDFGQFSGSFSFFKEITTGSAIVFSDKLGGGISIGKPAFFQALYLGGLRNLTGYRQYRFTGKHSFYNNALIRVKLGDFVNYILPGQIGLLGMYDVGRVWDNGDSPSSWHHGVGAGFYFFPASIALIKATVSYSKEGWYPAITLTYKY